MSVVQGLEGVKAMIGRAKSRYQRFPNFRIGFEAPYAIFVHENMQQKWKGLPRRPPKKGVYWGPAGEPKYLSRTMQRMRSSGEISRMIQKGLKDGRSLREATLHACLAVLREAQLRVPVDTGLLQKSGFVESGGQRWTNQLS